MGLFCIIGFDAPGSREKREKHLGVHIECLRQLNEKGKLFSAGPLMDSQSPQANACGSVLIIDFDDQQAAEAWFKQEPYYVAGVYAKVDIKPYLDAMPYCK